MHLVYFVIACFTSVEVTVLDGRLSLIRVARLRFGL